MNDVESAQVQVRRRTHGEPAHAGGDEQPWLNKPDWAAGRIESGGAAGLVVLWILALGFCGFGAAMVVAGWDDLTREGLSVIAFASIFPLAGLGLLGWALYATARYWKYGRSQFQLQTLPGVVGGWLRGEISTKYHPGINDQLVVRLSCIRRRVTGHGKRRSVKRSTVWQEELQLPHEAIRRGSAGETLIPVAFWVPRDCQPTTLDNPRDRHLWELEVEAETEGVDFHTEFEVPVFVTEASTNEAPPEAVSAWRITDDHRAEFSRKSKIRINPTPGGGTEIYVPAARNKGVAATLTVVTLFWSAAVYFLITQDAPLLFPIVFGLIDLLLIYSVASMWFGTSRTIARPDGLEVTNRILGLGGTSTIRREEIDAIDLKIGMQSGDKAYYRVYVRTHERKKHDIATGIRDKQEARWVIDTLQNTLQIA